MGMARKKCARSVAGLGDWNLFATGIVSASNRASSIQMFVSEHDFVGADLSATAVSHEH
jgi:hypothetical protein